MDDDVPATPTGAPAPVPPPSLPAELRSSALLFGLALLVTAGAATAAQAALRAVG